MHRIVIIFFTRIYDCKFFHSLGELHCFCCNSNHDEIFDFFFLRPKIGLNLGTYKCDSYINISKDAPIIALHIFQWIYFFFFLLGPAIILRLIKAIPKSFVS